MLKFCGVVLAGVVVSGCATVTRGTTETVQFYSEPAGAEVETSIGYRCTTPCVLDIKRKQAFTAVFKKPGFHAYSVPVTTKLSGEGAAAGAGNILIGGVIGLGTDAVTGAALDHTPNPVSVTLVPEDQPAPAPYSPPAQVTPANGGTPTPIS